MKTEIKVFPSKQDSSVNVVFPSSRNFFEARYVRRSPEIVNVYLSSQSGCNQGCGFCHLTASGQQVYRDATPDDFKAQAKKILEIAKSKPKAKICHFTFMARGEPFANPHLRSNGDNILSSLEEMALQRQLYPKYLISTIMPLKLTKPIEKIFLRSFPTIYYSLYTFDKSWRRRWIPASMDPSKALDMLAQWQQVSGKIIKIHHAFIEGVNDTQEHWEELTSTLKARKIHAELNIVDLNPAPGTKIRDCPTQFKQDAIAFWENEMATKAQHVRRVGFDVKASCGMFMGYKEL